MVVPENYLVTLPLCISNSSILSTRYQHALGFTIHLYFFYRSHSPKFFFPLAILLFNLIAFYPTSDRLLSSTSG